MTRVQAVQAMVTPITHRKSRKHHGGNDDEPSFVQVMMMISNQQRQEQCIRHEEQREEREERCLCYAEQREERCMQFQMHQDTMQQQSQFMTTMLMLMHGNMQGRAPMVGASATPHLQIPRIPRFGQTTIPAVNRQDESIIGEEDESKMENGEGETKTEEEERKLDEE